MRGFTPAALLVVIGCGARSYLDLFDEPTHASAGGADGSGAGAQGGGSDDVGAGGVGHGGTGGSVVAPRSCSRDLQYVTNADGVALETCAPDLGCYDGECIDPCEAARLSKSGFGCDILVPSAEQWNNTQFHCFALLVHNDWPKGAHVTVERDGQVFDLDQMARLVSSNFNPFTWLPIGPEGIPLSHMALMWLADDTMWPSCELPAAVSGDTNVGGTGKGKAFVLHSDVPVTAYTFPSFSMLGNVGGPRSGASAHPPVGAWGTAYVVGMPPKGQPPWPNQPAVMVLQVVAAENNTTVNVTPTVTLPAGPDVPGALAGQTKAYVLNAGEYLQWEGELDPSGTIVSANKPVGVVSGNRMACYESLSSNSICESVFEAVPSLVTLGHEYVAVPFISRRPDQQAESVLYRIVAGADDTTLSFEPPLTAAPQLLQRGEVADFETTQAFIVRSQNDEHPFMLLQIMPGGVTKPVPQMYGYLGGEEVVAMTPTNRYLKRYGFWSNDSYTDTQIVFVRERGPQGYRDVTHSCAGVLGGWQPIGSSDQFQFTRLLLTHANLPVSGCDNGPMGAFSFGHFSFVLWGLSQATSYGYTHPGGGGVNGLLP